ncbi:signal peptidase I [uncultured Dysosmobacter sp.]|uniref:signal peptidase I n=1 Tax=uncultured Dysosmobacter sp. TaxID=2591384 RepID=UPI002636E7F1|nr:signal peptidase I [uncultured Dysosmobacter sp.]
MAEGKKKPVDRGLYDWVQALVCSVLTVVLLFMFVAQIVSVSGPSMRETLQDKDRLLVLRGYLCGEYRQGDVVIFQRPDFENGELIVKRVIATEGQTVDIDFEAGTVYVDGEALEEPYTREPTWLDEGLKFPVTVPEGCVFLMGDNRNDSRDSRDSGLGPVDTRHILGRALLIAVPGETADLDRREWSRVGLLH